MFASIVSTRFVAAAALCLPLLAFACSAQDLDARDPEVQPVAADEPSAESIGTTSEALTPACAAWANDPVTGQKCPLKSSCAAYADCGTWTGTKNWYCSSAGLCEFSPSTSGNTVASGSCTAQLSFRQVTGAPWDKLIVPPDGISGREGTTLAFDITNHTTQTVYLDTIPLTLELTGTWASGVDVASMKLYNSGSVSDYGTGSGLLPVCSTLNPFATSANASLTSCGGSSSARLAAGTTRRFIVDLTFNASNKIGVEDRGYRLRMGSTVGVKARTGTSYVTATAYTACTIPNVPVLGSWLKFRKP